MDRSKGLVLVVILFFTTLDSGYSKAGVSFSSSTAVSGQPPQTYTYQSGQGVAVGYAGSTQPNGNYVYTTSVSRPRVSRELVSRSDQYNSLTGPALDAGTKSDASRLNHKPATFRTDAYQQRYQQSLLPGSAPPVIDYQRAPPMSLPVAYQKPAVSRTDAYQQRYQQTVLPGSAPPVIDYQRAPPRTLPASYQKPAVSRTDAYQQRYQQSIPTEFSPPGSSVQSRSPLKSEDYQQRIQIAPETGISSIHIQRTRNIPITTDVFQARSDSSLFQNNEDIYTIDETDDEPKGTPAEVYGPPEDSSDGGGISSDALGNRFRKPHRVYGPPGVDVYSFNSPDDTPSSDHLSGQYIFIPAFPDSENVVDSPDSIAFAPPSGSSFQPPDGALLSPSAPVVGSIPLPSPRKDKDKAKYTVFFTKLP